MEDTSFQHLSLCCETVCMVLIAWYRHCVGGCLLVMHQCSKFGTNADNTILVLTEWLLLSSSISIHNIRIYLENVLLSVTLFV